MQAMRSAFESGDRSTAHSRHDAVERQARQLTRRDEEFEKTLEQSLSEDQQARYKKWQDSPEKAEHNGTSTATARGRATFNRFQES